MKQPKPLQELDLNILRALSVAGGDENMMSAPMIAQTSRTLEYDLNATTIRRRLSALKNHVEYRTKDGIRKFRIKPTGRKVIVQKDKSGPIFVKPGTPWSSLNDLRLFLAEVKTKQLMLIDPYIAEETLEVLTTIKSPIKILTAQPGRRNREDDFTRAYKRFRSEKMGSVEIRIVSIKQMHGRYIFIDNCAYVFDHSIQDIGKSPSLILPLALGDTHKELYEYFNNLYKRGVTLN